MNVSAEVTFSGVNNIRFLKVHKHGFQQGDLAGDTKQPYIRALQCTMRGCLQKATAIHPDAIFFMLHCGAKLLNYGLILTCFSLSCNQGAISLSRVAFHM